MPKEKNCMIDAARGHTVLCPGQPCPYWENIDGSHGEGCALERLGLNIDDPEHARFFLDERALVMLLRERGKSGFIDGE